MYKCHHDKLSSKGLGYLGYNDFDEFLALVIALPVVWSRCRISKALPSSNQL